MRAGFELYRAFDQDGEDNRESLRRTLSNESILLWCMKTYKMRRRQYAECIAMPEFSHLRVLRFCHPREVESWLRSLPGSTSYPRLSEPTGRM